jgi:cell wall assembly regulator SMI1
MEQKAKFSQSEKGISNKEIEEFEQKFNIVLPANYKKLILIHNGGENENDDMLLSSLRSIKYGKFTLEQSIRILQIVEENIPRNYLPFADTGTGNIIALNVEKGNEFGKIYLFRHDELKPILLKESLEEILGVKNIEELD